MKGRSVVSEHESCCMFTPGGRSGGRKKVPGCGERE